MASESETLADIVAEMRDMGNYQSYSGDHAKRLAGRIEAAWRRERGAAWNEGYDHAKRDFRPIADELERLRNTPACNAAAMREALVWVKRLFDGRLMWQPDIHKAHEMVNAALSAPARNCDVGTAEEQKRRFKKYCETEECNRYRCGHGCKAVCIDRCALAWSQMPYKAQEGGAE